MEMLKGANTKVAKRVGNNHEETKTKGKKEEYFRVKVLHNKPPFE